MKVRFFSLVGIILTVLLAGCGGKTDSPAAQDDGKLHILCSTFPIYQFTRNVVGENPDVELSLMLPSQLGCPHSHALTPQDMQKLAKADLLIINGLGLEEFLNGSTQKANPQLKIIDTSAGVQGIIQEDGHQHNCEHNCAHSSNVNPHLFASPGMAVQLVRNIEKAVSAAHPDGAAIYHQQAAAYVAKLEVLAQHMAEAGNRLKNKRIVQPHGVFDYLARDIGLEIVAAMQEHGQGPSGADMLKLVETIKEKQVGAIFIEPQYPEQVGKVLAKETGIKQAVLDPVATGPSNASLDYYETTMRDNMKILEQTLGTEKE